jgi:cyclopropane fatty-acyl-phospholipid synthase-like methyltransferase
MDNRKHGEHDRGGHRHGAHGHDDRHGARQPERFDPARAALLDNPARFEHLPPDEVFAMLAAPAKSRVVDFGTGTGMYAIELARRRPDVEVIALDEQQPMLDLLCAKPAARELPNLTAMHVERSAELRGTADRVLAVNVLHEVGDEALAAMVALLKADGAVLVVDWNAAVERPVGPPREHVYTATEARKRIERAGLRAVQEQTLKFHYAILAQRRHNQRV